MIERLRIIELAVTVWPWVAIMPLFLVLVTYYPS
jgi:hypothetical protein